MIEVTIDSIRVSLLSQNRIVVLKEESSERFLPIWIGPFEADAIKMTLDGQQTARPMTHDLTLRLLASLGARVRQVVVSKLVGDTFYAEITTVIGEQQHIVDARPSDALALAVRAGIPIYVANEVMQLASGPDNDEFWKAMAERVRRFHAQAEAQAGET